MKTENKVSHTPLALHDLIRSLLSRKGEIIYGDTHVINISEEEEIDKFSDVHYRVYSKYGVFDCIQEYSSEAEDGGGGLIYTFYPEVWDGFETVEPISINKAYALIHELQFIEKTYPHQYKSAITKAKGE